MEHDYTSKTHEELVVLIATLKAENEKLREERNEQAVNLKQHIVRFAELREMFAKLQSEVHLLVKRVASKS